MVMLLVSQGGSCEISPKDDRKDFTALQSAMEILGFEQTEQDVIYKILSSVLHLGNIYFTKVQVNRFHIVMLLTKLTYITSELYNGNFAYSKLQVFDIIPEITHEVLWTTLSDMH